MIIEKGMFLRCKTKTKNDTFGTVLWEILEVGLQAPEKGRGHCQDGVKAIMLIGSGASAIEGMTVIDSEERIQRDILSGVTKILTADQKDAAMEQIKRVPRVATGTTPDAARDRMVKTVVGEHRHGGAGVVEVP